MAVNFIPEGFHSVTPYLILEDAPKLMEFVKAAFDAAVLDHHLRPDGMIMHAAVRIGDSMVEFSESRPEHPPMPTTLHLYVPDADATFQRAIDAGGVSIMEPTNMPYGERSGGVQDPCGNKWWIATRTE